MNIWTASFWKSVVERILATAAFAFIGFLSIDGFDLRTADWGDVLQAVGVAAALSLLKGIVANIATKTGPSLSNSEQVVPAESPAAEADQARGINDTPRRFPDEG